LAGGGATTEGVAESLSDDSGKATAANLELERDARFFCERVLVDIVDGVRIDGVISWSYELWYSE